MAVGVAVLVGAWAAGASPAAADCIGPSVRVAVGEVRRGDELAVVGEGLGTSCHDTGPPPPGEGVLGVPLQDLEVALVQGERAVVVGEVDADERYGFELDVVVPAELDPGPVAVRLRWDGGEATSAPVVIGDEPPLPTTATTATPGIDPGDTSRFPWWAVGVAALVAAGAAGVIATRRR